MNHSPLFRPVPFAATLVIACSTSPAFAAGVYLPGSQWSSYLLFGSIALLIAGVVGKLIKSGSDSTTPTTPGATGDAMSGIGMYRNSVLVRR